jgi:hypothetical protein
MQNAECRAVGHFNAEAQRVGQGNGELRMENAECRTAGQPGIVHCPLSILHSPLSRQRGWYDWYV